MTSTAHTDSLWESLTDEAKRAIRARLWQEKLRRTEQALPAGDGWTWYIRGGRGSGKTRAGAEGLAELIIASIQAGDGDEAGDWGIVAPTFGDGRDVCVEGPSGLRPALAGWTDGPWEKAWNRSQGQLRLANGATVFCDGADDGAPRVQGKNLRGLWADEVGLWKRWETAWDESIAFAVRLAPGCIIATGTPKAGHGLVRRLVNGDPDKGIPPADHQSHMKMADNLANLSQHMVDRLVGRYSGTTLGRQELEGELLDEVEGALWRPTLIDANRLKWPDGLDFDGRMAWANMRRVVVAVDPPGGATEAGIVVAGITYQCPCGGDRLPHALVLDDASIKGSPDEWGTKAVTEYREWRADRLVGEANFGGDMVESTIRTIDTRVAYKNVRATRGKVRRAEPVHALYEQGRIHHTETFGDLESEMTTWTPDEAWSPNRLDALVWAVTELEVETRPQTRRTGAALAAARIGGR